MDEYGMFKQALRGFDKDEVLAYIKQKEDEHGKQIISMERDIRKRDKVISELKSRIVLKDEQVERLEQEIRDKYPVPSAFDAFRERISRPVYLE